MSVVRAEGALGLREMKRRSTRTTTMQCRYPVMLSRIKTSAEPDMDFLNDKQYTTRPGKRCIKRVKRNMQSTEPFMRDGSAAKDTESRCRTMDGRRATSCCLTELLWKIIHILRQELSEFVTQNIGF